MLTSRSFDLHADMIDQLLEFYCAWREECVHVDAAYWGFSVASPPDRALAHAAYIAALDREESAARVYADQISRVSDRVRADAQREALLLQGCDDARESSRSASARAR
jgi:hypothetical protein